MVAAMHLLRRRSRRGTVVNSVLALALVGAAGFGGLLYVRDDGSSSDGDASTTATAQVMDVVQTVSASGSAAPQSTAYSSFGSDGTVAKVTAEVGDRVRKGQVLARAKGSSARLALTSAEAAYANAETSYDDALDAADGDTSDPAVGSAYAALLQAQVALRQAKQAVSGLVLRAPISGTLMSIGSVGDATTSSAASDSSDTSGDTGFATIAKTQKFVVTGDFSETDTAKLKVGQHASVTFNAMPGRSFGATVTGIDLESTTTDNVVSYGVEVLVADPPARLRSGQTGTVTVTTGRANNALAVPSAAVATAGGVSTVDLVTDTGTQTTTVETGLEGDSYTEITSGLSAGDTVRITLTGVGDNGFPTDGFPGGVVTRVGPGNGPVGSTSGGSK
jgi:membrane fusion protein, macrolide-specific efflux system